MGTNEEGHRIHNRNNRSTCSIRKDAKTARPLPQRPRPAQVGCTSIAAIDLYQVPHSWRDIPEAVHQLQIHRRPLGRPGQQGKTVTFLGQIARAVFETRRARHRRAGAWCASDGSASRINVS